MAKATILQYSLLKTDKHFNHFQVKELLLCFTNIVMYLIKINVVMNYKSKKLEYHMTSSQTNVIS